MPFEVFPYTNFHELNLDWILKEVKSLKEAYENIPSDQSLSPFKYYVTPEMYGAKGDGINDDTEAIRSAVASGFVVILMPKQYKTTDTIAINNKVPSFINYGTINYTGNTTAIDLQANVEKTHYMGSINALNGTCINIDSSLNGWSQYVNLYFESLRANYACINIHRTAGNWVNEYVIKGGKMSAGQYGIIFTNDGTTPMNHFTIHAGFEGVITGVKMTGVVTELVFDNCRLEETTTYSLETDNLAFAGSNIITWYGHYRLVTNGLNKRPIHVIGELRGADGSFLATDGVVYNEQLYNSNSFKSYDVTSIDATPYDLTGIKTAPSSGQPDGNYINVINKLSIQGTVNIDLSADMFRPASMRGVSQPVMLYLQRDASTYGAVNIRVNGTSRYYKYLNQNDMLRVKIEYIKDGGFISTELI